MTLSDRSKLLGVFLCGVLVRTLFILFGFNRLLIRRVEVSSPLTSWFRVAECIALAKHGLSPYDSDICHQPPLVLWAFKDVPEALTPIVFVILDMTTGVVLYFLAREFRSILLSRQELSKSKFASGIESLLLSENKVAHVPFTVACVYVMHPYTIITCVAQSTLVVNNFFTSLLLLAVVKRRFICASVCVGGISYLSLYLAMLLIPVALSSFQNSSAKITAVLKCVLAYLVSIAPLLLLSYRMYGSWQFMHVVHGFTLTAPDLTPNMGLFWYFFLEMFDHFKMFFHYVFQLNVFVYTVPVAIIFRKHPVLICYILLSLIALFKSYANFGDLSLPFALLPLWWMHIYIYTRNIMLILAMFLVTSLLAPGMWYLWIYAGSGNANFFYAVTLAYAAAQVFLLSDVLYAFLLREFHLRQGLIPKNKDGLEGKVVIK